MKEVVMYKASDGRLFNTAPEASRHEKYLEFYIWYGDNILRSNNVDNIYEWLSKNKYSIELLVP